MEIDEIKKAIDDALEFRDILTDLIAFDYLTLHEDERGYYLLGKEQLPYWLDDSIGREIWKRSQKKMIVYGRTKKHGK